MTVLEKQFLQHALSAFDDVPFLVKLPDDGSFCVGKGEPTFCVRLTKEIPKAALLKSTSLALGEAYMDGTLEVEGDLFAALDLFLGQMPKFHTDKKALKSLLFGSNSAKRQKEEVQKHYDIGNDFYSLWLDDTMSYSCGYFQQETDDLCTAQKNKVAHILKKLNLKEGMKLLDIGCGWGYLLIEAAKQYRVHGVGITLSEEQAKKFQERIEKEGLTDLLEVRLMDYRELPKSGLTFDRVVSVGMIEHVGRENYPLFLKCVKAVLGQGGVFLLHFISAKQEFPGDAWIRKYIFPGGTVPSLREILTSCGDLDFYTVDIESLRRHYTKTLLCWNQNFQKNKEAVEKLFDTQFARMWELYLCSCAATFHNGIIDLHQILLTNGVNNELPMTRDYLYHT